MAFVFGVSLAIANPKNSHAIASRDVPIRRATLGMARSAAASRNDRLAVTASAHSLLRRDVIFGTASSATLMVVPGAKAASAVEGEQPVGKAVADAYAAFAAGDIPSVLKSFSPNMVWEPAVFKGRPYKALYKGVAGAQDFFAELLDKETVTQFDVTDIVAQGNTAVGLVKYTTTVKATGKQYSTVLVHKWTLDSQGKLAAFKEYFSDNAACSAAFGA